MGAPLPHPSNKVELLGTPVSRGVREGGVTTNRNREVNGEDREAGSKSHDAKNTTLSLG
jgi:hypothetical protein